MVKFVWIMYMAAFSWHMAYIHKVFRLNFLEDIEYFAFAFWTKRFNTDIFDSFVQRYHNFLSCIIQGESMHRNFEYVRPFIHNFYVDFVGGVLRDGSSNN